MLTGRFVYGVNMSKTSDTPNLLQSRMVKLDSEWRVEIPEIRNCAMYLFHDVKLECCPYGGTWLDDYRFRYPNCSCKAIIPDKIYKKLLILEAARNKVLCLT
jgi:hypothetical protein